MIKITKEANIKPTSIDLEIRREGDVEEEVSRLFESGKDNMVH